MVVKFRIDLYLFTNIRKIDVIELGYRNQQLITYSKTTKKFQFQKQSQIPKHHELIFLESIENNYWFNWVKKKFD